jgi:F-type H+-transporting ATPase subunit b
MLSNSTFWVGVAFVIFMAICWHYGVFDKLGGGLDSRTKRIRNELDEAKRLREEASAVLAEYRKRAAEAEAEAAALVTAAREEAERVAKEAHERMTDFVARRTAAAEAKIAQAEANAAKAVRDAAAEAAVRVSETILRQDVKGPLGEGLLNKGLGEVRAKLHS